MSSLLSAARGHSGAAVLLSLAEAALQVLTATAEIIIMITIIITIIITTIIIIIIIIIYVT